MKSSKNLRAIFTTKGLGKGSGLGLSQALGFVRQARGTIKVDSKVGRGTTVTLFFPQVTANFIRRRRKCRPTRDARSGRLAGYRWRC